MENSIEKKIPDDIKTRVPLFRKEWMHMVQKLRNHPHAPHWNTHCGDRLQANDLEYVRAFEATLHTHRKTGSLTPEDSILQWIKDLTGRSWWFEDQLKGINPETAFHSIPCMERSDLQLKLEQIVPHDADLTGLIINPTSGTTGQPILCPSHPRAIGCYDPLIQFALQQHGIKETYNYEKVAAVQLCCQEHTITYNTVHAALDGAGFAKVNLSIAEWESKESPALYIKDLAPVFLSGDPFAFFQAMQYRIHPAPRALLTTALSLTPTLRSVLKNYFRCPVINLYSLNETGPIAYSCPLDPESFHLLPTDIFVETTAPDGSISKEGGELTVTGGRNPYLPLLRYRTGDSGVIDYSPCLCGDPRPRVKSLQARKTVFLYTKEGTLVNPVDICRILKDYPVLFHQFIQEKNYHCTLRLCTHIPLTGPMCKTLVSRLETLFHNTLPVQLTFDLSPSEKQDKGGKMLPFICNLNDQWINYEYF